VLAAGLFRFAHPGRLGSQGGGVNAMFVLRVFSYPAACSLRPDMSVLNCTVRSQQRGLGARGNLSGLATNQELAHNPAVELWPTRPHP